MQLYTCQTRPDSEPTVDPHVGPMTVCGGDVSPDKPFCAEHLEEYQALVERTSVASAEIEERKERVEQMLWRGAIVYADAEAMERDVEDVRRYLYALEEQIETQAVLGRRFFCEREWLVFRRLTS